MSDKIRINGETFDFDSARNPMTEALEIEQVLGLRFVEWEDELSQGSMRAMCGFVWKVLRRDGRAITAAEKETGKEGILLTDIIDGTFEVELTDLIGSLTDIAMRRLAEEEAAKEGSPKDGTGPTAPPRTATGGTAMTPTNTRPSSRGTSASGRGKSRSSTSPNSKPSSTT